VQQVVSVVPVQAAPTGLQVEAAAQRSTPWASGTHGARLQHWSRNWQTFPCAMQQAGLLPSQPVGHCCVPPPKQRITPFMSALQTAFLPLQQFCEAFTVPLAPQMLPGGLQLVPFEQVSSFVLQATLYPDGFTVSGVPPQHEAVESQ
jgi:hypothetical protein